MRKLRRTETLKRLGERAQAGIDARRALREWERSDPQRACKLADPDYRNALLLTIMRPNTQTLM